MVKRFLPLAAAVALSVAPAVPAASGRRVLAWPPTLYASAELILFRADDTPGPLEVHVVVRGLDLVVAVSGTTATRVPLPAGARCAVGVDACAIVAEAVLGEGAFEAILQSPDTAGVADTLLLSAHGTVRIPPPEASGRHHVIVAAACGRARDFPQTSSFASIVPVAGSAAVVVDSTCAGRVEAILTQPEVLTVACQGDFLDLTGALVDADAPVLVLSGNTVAPVPSGGTSLSADLLLDVTPPVGTAGETYVVPPLPRAAGLVGRGDVVRLVAGMAGEVVVLDDQGGLLSRVLAAGEAWDIDTAAAGADLTLLVTSEAPLTAWHVAKSRALRGTGDAAALALVPRSRFATASHFFMPDGYGEGAHLVLVAEPGAVVRLDGVPVTGFVAAPGNSGLVHARVTLPAPVRTTGSVHVLDGTAPFAAWTFGQGGFKAHGMVAAESWPLPVLAGTDVLRGTVASSLAVVARVPARTFADSTVGGPLYWQVEGATVTLRVRWSGADTVLAW